MNIRTVSERDTVVRDRFHKTLCVAGPGSGKTHLLVLRIASLLDEGVKPESIAVMTYTNAAANELMRRVDSIRSEGVQLGYVGTLHAFCLRELNRAGAGYSVADDDVIAVMLTRTAQQMGVKGRMTEIGKAFREWEVTGKTPANDAGIVVSKVVSDMKANRLLTFNALLNAYSVLDPKPDWIDHLLVDEAQDSSKEDAALYMKVPVKSCRFFVADPDQSIFGFRGGDPACLRDLALYARQFTVEANFRSDARICLAAQNLIEHNAGRFVKRTLSATGKEGEAQAVVHETAEDEAKWVVDRVRRMNQAETAILTRTNAEADAWASRLRNSGIPVRRASCVQTDEQKKLRAVVAWAASPFNDALAKHMARLVYGEDVVKRVEAAAAQDGVQFVTAAKFHPIDFNDLPVALEQMRFRPDTVGSVAVLVQNGCSDFIRLLDALRAGEQAANGKGVHVGTMHGAKGLEWRNVILPGFEDETIPARRPVDEERRLAYVAMTRAKSVLLISWSRLRVAPFGSVAQERRPSRFIGEAGLASVGVDVASTISRGKCSITVDWEQATVEYAVTIERQEREHLVQRFRRRRAAENTPAVNA